VPVQTPNDSAILDVVRETWGFDALRPLQLDAIRATLAGRDSLVVLPTGGGKSLCYQVPPLVSGRLTLVVSPLIALMKDQVDGLRVSGYPAAAIHSMCSREELGEIFRDLDSGTLKLLLVAPERVVTPQFLDRLARVAVGAIAIDEAHCISHWGHDFRPEYRRLAELRERFAGVPTQALTATATPRVREDIVSQLGLDAPAILVGTFDRPNLTYRVIPRDDPAPQIAEAIRRVEAGGGGASIVYAMSRKDTEALAAQLTALGHTAEAYHAGLDTELRRDIQDRFTRERLDVVVATVAFGMGIDRSDVRLVAHACMPKSVEAYQQEAGRAGRDGLPAECLLLYRPSDAARWKRLVTMGAEDASPEHTAAQHALIDQMRDLAGAHACRHRALAEHFGQMYEPDDCGACDVCLGEAETVDDATTIARKILSGVARTGQRFGANHVVDVLRGRNTQRVIERNHDRLSVFAVLKDRGRSELLGYIDQLVHMDVLERVGDEYPVLALGPRGGAVMRGDEEIELRAFAGREREPRRGARGAQPEARPLTMDERELFESLRSLRRELAEERNVPPYVIFSDATLRQIAMTRPGSTAALLRVKGVGHAKAEAFGDVVLAHVARFAEGGGGGEAGAPPDLAKIISRPPPRKRAPINPGAFALFDERRSIDEVAEALGRTTPTVAGYLERYVEEKRPDSVSSWVDDDIYARVAEAIDRLGDDLLRPIHDHLGGDVPYEQIRVVAAHKRAHAG
jgi:ATP-dependent DNA helicase RecQ